LSQEELLEIVRQQQELLKSRSQSRSKSRSRE
jgi:hypothetical protein